MSVVDAGQVQRVVLAAPAGSRDRAQAVDAAAGELADAAGPQPVVAEERKRVPQPLRERRQRRVGGGGVLMQEVDPQPGRHSSLAVEREKGIVHRVGVLAGDAGRRLVGVERARVAMRGDAELRVVLQRVERRALPRVRGQQLLAQRLQREPRRLAGDRAVGRDRHASRFEPRLAFAVGPSCRPARPGGRPDGRPRRARSGSADGARRTASRRSGRRS